MALPPPPPPPPPLSPPAFNRVDPAVELSVVAAVVLMAFERETWYQIPKCLQRIKSTLSRFKPEIRDAYSAQQILDRAVGERWLEHHPNFEEYALNDKSYLPVFTAFLSIDPT